MVTLWMGETPSSQVGKNFHLPIFSSGQMVGDSSRLVSKQIKAKPNNKSLRDSSIYELGPEQRKKNGKRSGIDIPQDESCCVCISTRQLAIIQKQSMNDGILMGWHGKLAGCLVGTMMQMITIFGIFLLIIPK